MLKRFYCKFFGHSWIISSGKLFNCGNVESEYALYGGKCEMCKREMTDVVNGFHACGTVRFCKDFLLKKSN